MEGLNPLSEYVIDCSRMAAVEELADEAGLPWSTLSELEFEIVKEEDEEGMEDAMLLREELDMEDIETELRLELTEPYLAFARMATVTISAREM